MVAGRRMDARFAGELRLHNDLAADIDDAIA
jgi:hypothetical protein